MIRIIKTIIAITIPAKGPAAPTSISCFLFKNADFDLISAPKVPMKLINGGAGIKYGRVTLTL